MFGAISVEFLRHIISGGKIEMEPNKKDAIIKWKSPLTTPKQVRQFLRTYVLLSQLHPTYVYHCGASDAPHEEAYANGMGI